MDRDAEKQAAGEWAADLVRPGMVVGLGTGSTAIFALRRIAARIEDGDLTEVVGVPTSTQVEAAARELRIPLSDLEAHPIIDLTIDGADEVDAHFNLIKGGGGALLREKIVAQASRREVIVVDATKCSDHLGTRHRLPVEVADFGWRPEALHLEALGADVVLRRAEDRSVFRTDGGNLILDADLGPIEDPETLAATLLSRAGVVEVGLFCGLVNDVVIGTLTGVEHRLGSRRPSPRPPASPIHRPLARSGSGRGRRHPRPHDRARDTRDHHRLAGWDSFDPHRAGARRRTHDQREADE